MARRRRFYKCEGPFTHKRDALAEAAIIRSIGHKATVKRDAAGYKVCRTTKRKRRR